MNQHSGIGDSDRSDHPVESAPPEVKEIIKHVLKREHEMRNTRKGVTPDDVVKIIKAVIP